MAEHPNPHGRSLIVCVSEHHGNTRKVAEAMAEALDAEVVAPEDLRDIDTRDYDLIGFGSGIYLGWASPRLGRLVDRLPAGTGRAAFTFSTSGAFILPFLGMTKVRRGLHAKGYKVLDDFNCRGYDTMGPLRFIGGLNRGRPDDDDLDRAATFARQMRTRAAGASTSTV